MGPFQGTLLPTNKAFIRPVLSYASPEWFSFLYNALKKDLEVYHKSACRIFSGYLASTLVPTAALEVAPSPSPLLEIITLNQKELAF